jgi:hypothetical protein
LCPLRQKREVLLHLSREKTLAFQERISAAVLGGLCVSRSFKENSANPNP